MKKVLVVFLFVLFSFSSISYGGTPDPEKWHLVAVTDSGVSHYLYIPDLNAGRQLYKTNPYRTIFKIWTLTTFPDGRSDKLQSEYDLSENKRIRMLGSVSYDKNGQHKESFDFSRFAKWDVVAPETIREALHDDASEWIKSK